MMDARTASAAGNVLVVTDDGHAAEAINMSLASAGLNTASVRRQRTATSVVLNEPVSVVVLAYSSGRLARTTALAASLRSRPEPRLSETAIVAIVDDASDAAFGLCDAADVVLYRPFDVNDLVDAVTDLAATPVERRRLRRGLLSVSR